MEIFLESEKETSKLSGNVFWDRWDHLVAQKSKKCDFFAQMTLIDVTPLPNYLRDISDFEKPKILV